MPRTSCRGRMAAPTRQVWQALTNEPRASLAVRWLRWRRGEQVHIQAHMQAQTGHGRGDGADGVEQLWGGRVSACPIFRRQCQMDNV
jgi:hypothetical protein